MGFSLKSLLKPALGIAGTAMFGPLGGLAGGALGGMLGGKKKVATPGINPAAQGSLDGQLGTATTTLQKGAFGNTGFEGLSAWDPEAAYAKKMAGAQDQVHEAFGKGIEDLAAAGNRTGRRDTGYFAQDVGDFGRGLAREFSRTASDAAINVSGQTGDKYRSMAGIEEGRTGTYLDFLSGQKDRQQAEANAKAQRKSNRTNSIIGGIAQIGGAAIGNWLGSR